jgi:hypothetical protein
VSPAKSKLDPKILAAVGGGVVVLVLLALFFWPSAPETTPPGPETAAQPAPAQPAPAPAAKTTTTAPAKSAAAAEPRATNVPAGMAQLNIDCRHDFRTAKLEVYVDGKLFTETTLTGTLRSNGNLAGSFRSSKPISPGTQTIRVLVASPLYGFEQQQEISGVFRAGAARTLQISAVTSGSDRVLSLSWR